MDEEKRVFLETLVPAIGKLVEFSVSDSERRARDRLFEEHVTALQKFWDDAFQVALAHRLDVAVAAAIADAAVAARQGSEAIGEALQARRPQKGGFSAGPRRHRRGKRDHLRPISDDDGEPPAS